MSDVIRPKLELYPPVTMPNPRTVAWVDIERLAQHYTQVRHAVALVERDEWSREQALLMLVHLYVDAWQRAFQQLVDRRMREMPNGIVSG